MTIRILGVGNSLITGLQGAGKSHFVMSQIVQILADEPNLNIYLANVDGVTLESPNLHIVSPDFSWVDDAPNNSLIIYDEAGTIERFNNSSTRINSSKDVQTLTMARHQGKTIVFMAQDSSIVHPAVRKLLTRHFHFSNPYNDKDKTHCFVFPQVQDRLDGQNKAWQKNAIEEFKHELDPDIFPLYKSVDDGAKHNKKKQINAKAKRAFMVAGISAALVVPAVIMAVYFGLSYAKDVWGDKPQDTEAQSPQNSVVEAPKLTPNAINPAAEHQGYINSQNRIYMRTQHLYEQRLPKDYVIITSDDNLRPAGVMRFGGRCQVYNGYGDPMNYSKQECEQLLVTGVPKSRSRHSFVSSHGDTSNDAANEEPSPMIEPVSPDSVDVAKPEGG